MAEMNPNKPAGSGLAPNVASLIAYLCGIIAAIIFLVIEKENKEVRFHAWQSLFLQIAAIAGYIVLLVLTMILGMVAGPVALIGTLLMVLFWIGFMVVWILCMVKAYQGQQWRIPYLGDFAAKQAGV